MWPHFDWSEIFGHVITLTGVGAIGFLVREIRSFIRTFREVGEFARKIRGVDMAKFFEEFSSLKERLAIIEEKVVKGESAIVTTFRAHAQQNKDLLTRLVELEGEKSERTRQLMGGDVADFGVHSKRVRFDPES